MLTGKTIVVFGGSGLLGSAIVGACREAGASVLAPTREEVNLVPVLRRPEGYEMEGWDWCPSQKVMVEYLKAARDKHGRLDGTVNAIRPRGEWISEKGWEVQVQDSLITHAAAATMRLQPEGGSVVTLGSIYGKIDPDPAMYVGTEIEPDMAYARTKRWVHEAMTVEAKSVLRDCKAPDKGPVRFNCVAPGGIFNGHSDRFVEQYSARVPMKRMGTPEDVTGLVVFLLSDASSYVTGQVVFVSGGFDL